MFVMKRLDFDVMVQLVDELVVNSYHSKRLDFGGRIVFAVMG